MNEVEKQILGLDPERARREALRANEALMRYGQHEEDCPQADAGADPCDCGLDAACYSPFLTHEHMTGADRIAAERQRQIDTEGWSPEHDRMHAESQLQDAAAAYLEVNVLAHYIALVHRDRSPEERRYRVHRRPPPSVWPWATTYWKPSEDPVRNLEKAGALIAAEIDRLLAERGDV